MYKKKENTDISINNKPTEMTIDDSAKLQLFRDIVNLIEQKYCVEVQGRFDFATPDTFKLAFSDNAYVQPSGERKNQKALDQLKEFGGKIEQEKHPFYSYLTTSILILPIAQCSLLKETFEKLDNPNEDEIAQRDGNTISMC